MATLLAFLKVLTDACAFRYLVCCILSADAFLTVWGHSAGGWDGGGWPDPRPEPVVTVTLGPLPPGLLPPCSFQSALPLNLENTSDQRAGGGRGWRRVH